MRYFTILSVLALLVSGSRTAAADPILFTFTGDNDLVGRFTLDDDAPFTFSSQLEILLATLSSPIQGIQGTYGNHRFEGTAGLFVMDQPEFFSSGQEALLNDSWIVRSTVSGPELNGRTPTDLNLFVYTSAAALAGASLTLPPFVLDPTLFQYTIRFSDGTTVAAPLNTLQKVAEPSSLLLLGLGFAGLALVRQRVTVRQTPS